MRPTRTRPGPIHREDITAPEQRRAVPDPGGLVMEATREQLEAGLGTIRRSPGTDGVVEMIIRRPQPGQREVLDIGRLDVVEGLVGDCWSRRRSAHRPDGSANPDMQLSVMNSRVISLLAGERSRWSLSGDQLFVDLDLSVANLPAGTRLAVGGAVIAVTDPIHISCKAFVTRYGMAAAAFVHSPEGTALRLRGINAKVVSSGDVRVGDPVKKLSSV